MRALCGRHSSLLFALVIGAALVGCEDNPPPATLRPPPELPPVALDTPENAARSTLAGLQAELRAIANHNDQAAQAALEQLRALVATESVERNLNRMPQFKTLLGEDLIEGYINNWGAAIAYYAEHFAFDRMHRASEAPSKVAVIVPASGREDDALIQVTCLRQTDDTWHVSRIQFVTESAAPAAISPATTQSAPEP